MKNVFLSIVALTAMASVSLADQAPVTTVVKAVAPAAVIASPAINADKVLVGMVKAVSLPDAIKGTKSEMIVTDMAGKDVAILVKATTTLYAEDSKAITLDKVTVNSKVTVIYKTSAEGVNEAKSVKIVQ